MHFTHFPFLPACMCCYTKSGLKVSEKFLMLSKWAKHSDCGSYLFGTLSASYQMDGVKAVVWPATYIHPQTWQRGWKQVKGSLSNWKICYISVPDDLPSSPLPWHLVRGKISFLTKKLLFFISKNNALLQVTKFFKTQLYLKILLPSLSLSLTSREVWYIKYLLILLFFHPSQRKCKVSFAKAWAISN